MQIILKQRDIEQALRLFIAAKGINLFGKTVEISFTAGRKESGLSAELQIEEDESEKQFELLSIDLGQGNKVGIANAGLYAAAVQAVEPPFVAPAASQAADVEINLPVFTPEASVPVAAPVAVETVEPPEEDEPAPAPVAALPKGVSLFA